MTKFMALLFAGALALVLAACGGDGDDRTIDVGDGEVNVSDDLPDDFPDDFPVYPDADLQGSATAEEEGVSGFVVTWQTGDSLDDVVSFYDEEFGGDSGWTQVTKGETGEGTFYAIQNEDDDLAGTLTLTESDGNTVIAAFIGTGDDLGFDETPDDGGDGDDTPGDPGDDPVDDGDDDGDDEGSGASLPDEQELSDDFPSDEVPLPDDSRVTQSSSVTTGGQTTWLVTFYTEMSAEDISQHFEDELTGNGWTQAFTSTSNGETITSYTQPDEEAIGLGINVLISDSDVEGYREVTLTVNI